MHLSSVQPRRAPARAAVLLVLVALLSGCGTVADVGALLVGAGDAPSRASAPSAAERAVQLIEDTPPVDRSRVPSPRPPAGWTRADVAALRGMVQPALERSTREEYADLRPSNLVDSVFAELPAWTRGRLRSSFRDEPARLRGLLAVDVLARDHVVVGGPRVVRMVFSARDESDTDGRVLALQGETTTAYVLRPRAGGPARGLVVYRSFTLYSGSPTDPTSAPGFAYRIGGLAVDDCALVRAGRLAPARDISADSADRVEALLRARSSWAARTTLDGAESLGDKVAQGDAEACAD